MKLLLFLVSVIAFLTVNCSDFPDGHQEHSLTDRLQQLEETRLDDGTENSGSSELNFPDGHQEHSLTDRLQQLEETRLDDGTENSGSSELNFPDEQQEHNLTDRLQQLEETSVDDGLDDGTENSGSSELNELMKEKKGQHKSELQRSRCKSRNACVVMGGFCVTNVTHCEGRLVADGCKGKDCQCCIPEIVNTCRVEGGENSTLWQKFDIVEAALTAIVDEGNNNITRDMDMSINNLTMSMNNMMSHQGDMEIKFQALHRELKSKIDNLTNILIDKIDNLNITNQDNCTITNQAPTTAPPTNTTTTTIATTTSCPSGFFSASGSDQCFKFYGDTRRNWEAASQKCISENLVLAKLDTNPIEVRRYLLATYGLTTNSHTWIGAKGDNSEVRWQQGNSIIPKSSSYWWRYETYSSKCLMLTTNPHSQFDNKPYSIWPCDRLYWTLCEKV